jgi:hypothetical protein
MWRRSERELVVARYTESVSWLLETNIPARIYNKGNHIAMEIRDRRATEVIRLRNWGREPGAYLTHIIHHYKDLSELTIFCQGDPFPHSPDFLDRIELLHDKPITLTSHYSSHFPSDATKSFDTRLIIDGFECNYGLATAPGQFPHVKVPLDVWANEIWEHTFAVARPEFLYFGYGNMYAVPKRSILSRSRSNWIWLLNELNAAERKIPGHPLDCWAFEALMWHFYLDPEKYPLWST